MAQSFWSSDLFLHHQMKIFVTSYTYIYEHSYGVFDYFKNKEDVVFVLPKKWKSTKGTKTTVYPKERKGFKFITTSAPFYHSHYPIMRGHLKGWMPNLANILKKEAKPGDILYSSYEPNLLVTYLYSRLAKKLGLKHVFFTWQNVPYKERMSGPKLKIIEWFVNKNIELSVGGLCGMRRAYEIHEPYFKNNKNLKVDIIPQTGINTDMYRPGIVTDFRKKHGLENKFIFLYTATFTERKGTLPTLYAFNQICKNLPRAHLLMIGMGNLEAELKKRIGDLNLSGRVTVLPWQPVGELAPIYAQVDVLVHPSEPHKGWEEQFGLLMLQAQACGTPIITTKSGSLEETVLDRKTGILVKPGEDVEGVAEAMLLLAEDEILRLSLGKTARQYMLDHFSNQSVGERLEKFLRNL